MKIHTPFAVFATTCVALLAMTTISVFIGALTIDAHMVFRDLHEQV